MDGKRQRREAVEYKEGRGKERQKHALYVSILFCHVFITDNPWSKQRFEHLAINLLILLCLVLSV